MAWQVMSLRGGPTIQRDATKLAEFLTQKLLVLDSIEVTPETRQLRKAQIVRINSLWCDASGPHCKILFPTLKLQTSQHLCTADVCQSTAAVTQRGGVGGGGGGSSFVLLDASTLISKRREIREWHSTNHILFLLNTVTLMSNRCGCSWHGMAWLLPKLDRIPESFCRTCIIHTSVKAPSAYPLGAEVAM